MTIKLKLNNLYSKLSIASLLLITSLSSQAQITSQAVKAEDLKLPNYELKQDGSDFFIFVSYLIQQGKELGFSDTSLEILKNLEFNQQIITFDQRQVEYLAALRNKRLEQAKNPNEIKKVDVVADYLRKHLSKRKTEQAAKLLIKHKAELTKVAQVYKVNPETIVALWGLETGFGAIQGTYKVLDSLATLAYEGRRRPFFTQELFNALKVIELNGFKKEELLGSWAGAMGQMQFMPSTYLNHAVDGNKNKRTDIWKEQTDVFPSIANYLKNEGWDNTLGWGEKVTLPSGFDIEKYHSLKLLDAKTAQEWSNLGIKLTKKYPADTKLWLNVPDRIAEQAFIITNNFKVYMIWNSSSYFALANSMFADAIAKRVKEIETKAKTQKEKYNIVKEHQQQIKEQVKEQKNKETTKKLTEDKKAKPSIINPNLK